jgi:hypothetical protein
MNSTKQEKNNANPKVTNTMKSKIEKMKGNSMQGRCEKL